MSLLEVPQASTVMCCHTFLCLVLQAKLGGTPQESASVGAAVGSGVETARSVVEDEGGKESGSKADDVGESGGAAGTHSEGGDSGSGKGKPEGEEAAGQSEEKQGYIPRLYAPGELLYLRTTPGLHTAREPSCLSHANAHSPAASSVLCLDCDALSLEWSLTSKWYAEHPDARLDRWFLNTP